MIAHGFVIGVIGKLFMYAAWRVDPQEAGGVGEASSWLANQPYGQILVVLICFGLLGFAAFYFVNAAYRVVPNASGPDLQALATRLRS